MSQQNHTFNQQATTNVTLNYLLHVPPTIHDGTKHPLILFLHGSGERGENIELVKAHGLPKNLEEQPDFPFIVVSPQCPTNDMWVFHGADLRALLDDLCNRYPVDTTRIYLTGLSMGGTGTWFMAAQYPNYFAAIAPVCGDGHLQLTQRLTRTPIWAFHGEKDDVILPERSQLLVGATQYFGGDAQLTLYPDLNHNSWDRTYGNPDLYAWFLEHHR